MSSVLTGGNMEYYYSCTTNAFYPKSLLENYKLAGTLPDDVQPVGEDVFIEFSATPPDGMQRSAGVEGLPVWEEIPPVVLSEDEIKGRARLLRDSFISSTDSMLVEDYTINDIKLTDEQRAELLKIRLDFKKWPSQIGWPVIVLPEIPQWLLVEAVNNGYRVYNWPEF